MTRTLLLALNVSDGSLLSDLAVDVENDLIAAGHDVVSVRPWGSPLDQLTPTTPITLPTATPLSPVEPAPPQENQN
jgi:hypothetical protein